jgi:4-diphosphocytidyl-2-C-methyl-D-erythritol kinase
VSNAPAARVWAQGKTNLFLRVLAREASGFHQIETLFCRLALSDDVVVRVDVPRDALEVDGPDSVPRDIGPESLNLAWRALEAYRQTAGWPARAEIRIAKRIPAGGGLGGGSADAGAVLRCLDALATFPIGPERLLALAASLGSDVPFLTQAISPLALAWGRGDRLLMLPPLPSRPAFLATFPFGVPTGDAYGWLAESRQAAAPVAPRIYALEDLTSWEGVARLAHNDFEAVVTRWHTAIGGVLDALRTMDAPALLPGRRMVQLSGTGATVVMIGLDDPGTNWMMAVRSSEESLTRLEVAATAVSVEPVELLD